jgi:hypothetical protein
LIAALQRVASATMASAARLRARPATAPGRLRALSIDIAREQSFITERAERGSTTRLTLRWLQAGLLTGAALVFTVSFLAFQGVQATVDTVRGRTVPAVVAVSAARAAMVAADGAAIDSFSTPQAQLTGPGTDYRNQISIASQNLAQVAQYNVAGGAGSQTLELVEALVVSYTGLIEQADAHNQLYSTSPGQLPTAAVVDLWNAWSLLHGQILPQLNDLQMLQEEEFARAVSSGWIGLAIIPLWAAPLLALLTLLVATQVFLDRRFRRLLNPPLIGATALLIASSVGMYGVVDSHRQLDEARQGLSQVVRVWGMQTSSADIPGLSSRCQNGGGCGDDIARYLAGANGVARAGGRVPVPAGIDTVRRQVADADPTELRLAGIPAAAAVIAVLVMWGLRPLLEQYRYRPR